MASSATILSTDADGRRYGMVATAVMSVSLEPPSIAVGVNRSASIHDPLQKRGAFAVNILGRFNAAVAHGFAASRGEERFGYGEWLEQHSPDGPDGLRLPYLAEAQAVVFCRVRDLHAAGTHSLIIGEAVHILRQETLSPLIYCDGRYGSFHALTE